MTHNFSFTQGMLGCILAKVADRVALIAADEYACTFGRIDR